MTFKDGQIYRSIMWFFKPNYRAEIHSVIPSGWLLVSCFRSRNTACLSAAAAAENHDRFHSCQQIGGRWGYNGCCVFKT